MATAPPQRVVVQIKTYTLEEVIEDICMAYDFALGSVNLNERKSEIVASYIAGHVKNTYGEFV